MTVFNPIAIWKHKKNNCHPKPFCSSLLLVKVNPMAAVCFKDKILTTQPPIFNFWHQGVKILPFDEIGVGDSLSSFKQIQF